MKAQRQYGIGRFVRRILFSLAYKSFFITSRARIKLLRMCGVCIGKNCFVGQFVFFDDLYPQNIHIGNNTIITSGVKILSHFYNTKNSSFEVGIVNIGDDVFVGMNSLIVKPVSVGNGSVIGAGSVVIHDVLPHTVCAGNPAKLLKVLGGGGNYILCFLFECGWQK